MDILQRLVRFHVPYLNDERMRPIASTADHQLRHDDRMISLQESASLQSDYPLICLALLFDPASRSTT